MKAALSPEKMKKRFSADVLVEKKGAHNLRGKAKKSFILGKMERILGKSERFETPMPLRIDWLSRKPSNPERTEQEPRQTSNGL
ncbi:hypothetical protein [Blastopirellula retiformator]|uniref:hypothetical protein n=1 Tax=Blastopirellula retiformator TaxID=2527970 RepID=UPI001C9656DC|nr:hypothetical protein [Blastopirellula retiformator]